MAESKAKSEKLSSAAMTNTASGCLILFALPFAMIGVGAAAAIVLDLSLWFQMRDWVETPATILASALVTEDGDDSATYRVTATYAYDFAGKHYESQRVALHGGSDNLGQFHQRAATALEMARKAGRPFPCYVNPGDHADAILFRELRPGVVIFKLMFALIFGAVGFGLLFGGIWARRAAKHNAALEKQHPNEPWLWRPDWAARRIRSSGAVLVWFVTFFAIFWNSAVAPICYAVWSGEREVPAKEIWLLGLFPLAGFFLAVWAAYLWRRRFKWGVSELELAAVPGVIGGPLGGLVHVPRGVEAPDGYFLKLRCIEKVETVSGGETSTEDKTVWEHEQRVPPDAALSADGRTVIPVQLMIPYRLPSTDRDKIRWQLEARAETPGVDYHAEFVVPVFKTAASSRKVVAATESAPALSEEEEAVDFATVVERMGARIERETPAGRMLVFPMARHRGLAMYSVVFLIFWIAVAAYLFTTPAPRIVAWILVGIAALTFIGVVVNVFWQITLEFGPHGVAREWRVLAFHGRREFRPREIADIRVKRSGGQFGKSVYREVELATTANKAYTLAPMIPNGGDAERLALEIREAIRPRGSRSEDRALAMELESELPEELRQE
jgi:hypothetical protein